MISLIWAAILAFVAGPDGPPAVEARGDRRPSLASCDRGATRGTDQLQGPGRRGDHLPDRSPWSVSGVEEFDTEEVDESWMLHLDAALSTALASSGWGVPRSRPDPIRSARYRPKSGLRSPLRC